MLDAPARLARNVAWLFNPVLYHDLELHLEISQEEIGLLSGMSRQMANKSLQILESEGLLRVEHGGITVLESGAAGALRRLKMLRCRKRYHRAHSRHCRVCLSSGPLRKYYFAAILDNGPMLGWRVRHGGEDNARPKAAARNGLCENGSCTQSVGGAAPVS